MSDRAALRKALRALERLINDARSWGGMANTPAIRDAIKEYDELFAHLSGVKDEVPQS